MSKENFFVGIKNPTMIRRLLLNSSKDVLDALKDYENFESIKAEKARHIIELKRTIDEILVLNKKLKGHLPQTPLVGPAKRPSIGTHKKSHSPRKMIKVASKMDLLESELSKVEKRLKSLE
jgi:hypothetical protein